MKTQIEVSVSAEKKAEMFSLLSEISIKDLQSMSFWEKRDVLNILFSLTSNMIEEQGKAFNEAIERIDEKNQVSVLLDPDVSKLIDDGIKLQKQVMNSYL